MNGCLVLSSIGWETPGLFDLIRRWLKAWVLETCCLRGRTQRHMSRWFYQCSSKQTYVCTMCWIYGLRVLLSPEWKVRFILIRYLDDFVVCFQLRAGCGSLPGGVGEKASKFSLRLEPNKDQISGISVCLRAPGMTHWPSFWQRVVSRK